MGESYSVTCKECGAKYQVNVGGGFSFHLLHCDTCGREGGITFDDLGDLHLRYVKGLFGPYCIAFKESDKKIQQEYSGEPLDESQYHSEVEALVGSCECGGKFKLDAPARCPRCKSTESDPDSGPPLMYD